MASDLCDISDDLTEEAKVAELLPIIVQQLYVDAILSKREAAEALRHGDFVETLISHRDPWNSR